MMMAEHILFDDHAKSTSSTTVPYTDTRGWYQGTVDQGSTCRFRGILMHKMNEKLNDTA
jgi:hypothetical protein